MVAIIGAGALGLFLGNYLNKHGIDFKIFNDGKIAKKLLASGNGRCNLGNVNLNPSFYHNPKYVEFLNVKDDVYNFLEELGIYTKIDNEGRMYPLSESSKSVCNILLKNISNRIIDEKITTISKSKNKYYLNSNGPFDKIVLAIGSNASTNDNNFYELLDNLNLKYQKFMPSLVGFKTYENLKSISGEKSSGSISLYQNDKLIYQENGKFIFKEDGINGICVMNISSYYERLKNKNNCYFKIDFYPDMNKFNSIEGLFTPNLYKYISSKNIDIHNFVLKIKDTYPLNTAQVGFGGILLDEINFNNLTLKKDKNIYAGGEILNIDGICGGYNLYFAFSTALIIGRSICEI